MPEEIEGHALETLLFQELNAVNDYLELGYKIFYWKTSNNIEVDFVLYGDRGIRVFEVKRTGKVTSSMLRGIRAFLKDYPFAKAYFIYGGERHLREGDIEILPVKYVLKELPALLS